MTDRRDGMPISEHYEAKGDGVNGHVLRTGRGLPAVIAHTAGRADAEMIASALNARGAVEQSCDCCGEPIQGRAYNSEDYEAAVCAHCCVQLLAAEVQALRQPPAGAVSAALDEQEADRG